MTAPGDQPSGVVLDASAALAWCFEDEWSPAADTVLQAVQDDGALVPPLWELEVVTVFVVAERRGRITSTDTTRFLALLDALPIEIAENDPPMTELAAVARAHQLSAYDAAYVLTALRSGWPLATLDAELRSVAETLGCRLLLG